MRKNILLIFILALSLQTFAQAPNVTLREVNGKSINVREFCEEGHPTIISFFATWCKPCMRELKAINEVYEDWQEETGVRLLAVSIDRAQDVEKVKPLVDGNDWEYTVVLDTDNELKRLMQVQAIPHIFVYDRKGKLVDQRSGYTDGEEHKLYQLLKKL